MNTLPIREWFILRFNKLPDEDFDYYQEWVHRFKEGENMAIKHMDLRSRGIWKRVIKWHNLYR